MSCWSAHGRAAAEAEGSGEGGDERADRREEHRQRDRRRRRESGRSCGAVGGESSGVVEFDRACSNSGLPRRDLADAAQGEKKKLLGQQMNKNREVEVGE